ncbi:MAG: leucine-rich repeat domain-containing protein [Bacilli bacterium]|jgi:hypothetical protein|nr:leucine-rich repeat domain-containing protein [Bacilli bacterium]
MKSTKLILPLILVSSFLFSCSNVSPQQTISQDGIKYELAEDKASYAIAGYEDSLEGKVSLPGKVNGATVKSLKSQAFKANSKITSVICPDSIETIEEGAFYDCASLSEIDLGKGVKDIADVVFYKDPLLKHISMPSSIESIGVFNFNGCASLEYNIKDNAYYLGNSSNPFSLLWSIDTKASEVEIPSQCAVIAPDAFNNVRNSVLKKVLLPSSLKGMGLRTFYNSFYLEECNLPKEAPLKTIPEAAFFSCCSLKAIQIPNKVEAIETEAFYNCKSLTSLVLPDSLLSLGVSSFRKCEGLTEITLGKNLTSLGDNAFMDCISLEKLTLPSSLKEIGKQAFLSCSSLNQLVIPESVTSIADYAFAGCTNLSLFFKASSLPSGVSSLYKPSSMMAYFYSEGKPTSEGSYWHYQNNIPTAW